MSGWPRDWLSRQIVGSSGAADGMDTVLGAAAVIHDVTGRCEREKRAKERLLQLEAGGRRV